MNFYNSPIAFLLTLLLGGLLACFRAVRRERYNRGCKPWTRQCRLVCAIGRRSLARPNGQSVDASGNAFSKQCEPQLRRFAQYCRKKAKWQDECNFLNRKPFALVYNGDVQRFIDLYTQKTGANEPYARRGRLLLPDVRGKFGNLRSPTLELKYLAVVESALNPRAVACAELRAFGNSCCPRENCMD